MTVKGGTSQACAACKYQRRKCSADCALAPYFPPNQPKLFQNAHRLFGVSNILKILKQIHPSQKNEAMTSIIFQSAIREKFPVQGCLGVIMNLQYEIEQSCMELEAIKSQLAIYRQHQQLPSSPPTHHSPSSQLQLGMTASPNNALPLFQQPYNMNVMGNIGSMGSMGNMGNGMTMAPPQHQQALGYGNNLGYNSGYVSDSSKENGLNPLWVQQHSYNQNNNNSVTAQYTNAQSIPFQVEEAVETTQDYDEMPAFFDSIDDRQSYIDSTKEAYESSSESSLKDTTRTIEHVSENELKSAAACFSLTSVN